MIWVDNSILEATAKCSTQVLMRYVFGWATKGGKIMANAGKAIHKSHESWFANWQVEHAMQVFDHWYEQWVAPDAAELEPKDPCNKENLRAVVEQYYLNHPADFFPFTPLVEWMEKVHAFTFGEIAGEEVMFFGLVDLPVREKKTNALYVCDHKNRFGYINEWWTKKFALTSQFTGYIWVLQKLHNEMVPGVYVNAIQVQKLPDPTTRKCSIHKTPYAECWQQHANSQLFITTRTPQALECWETQAKALAARFVNLKKAFSSVEMVPYAPDEGRFSGACVFCDFRKWCRADRPVKLVEGMFVHEPWEPWKEGE
jgi:hypothetical protein